MKQNTIYLEKLSILLRAFDKPILEACTRDSLVTYSTNQDELDRSVAILDNYASNNYFLNNRNPLGGIAIVVPYNAPILALFGKSLAAALLVNGNKYPIRIHFSSILSSFAKAIKSLFDYSDDFDFIQICQSDTKEFMENNLQDESIKSIHVYGGNWVNEYISKAIEKQTALVYEGSGNNPAIVHKTADLEDAADKILEMAFSLSGQTMVSFNRLLVDKGVDEVKFNAILKRKCDEISFTKDPFQNAIVGPIKLSQIVFALENRVIDAISEGAIPYNYHIEAASHGWLIKPSLFFNTNHKMRLVQEENFSPVLTVEYVDEDKLVTVANSTEFGFTASVFGDPKEINTLINELNKSHGIVLRNMTFNELISKEYGYAGIWGGYGKSFFHLSESTNWQLSQELKPLVTYFSN